jgi:hypothetical protein
MPPRLCGYIPSTFNRVHFRDFFESQSRGGAEFSQKNDWCGDSWNGRHLKKTLRGLIRTIAFYYLIPE